MDAEIEVGMEVEQGDTLGTMSDNGSPGQVHLHLEIRDDNDPQDPME